MTTWSDEAIGRLHTAFADAGDPQRREPMTAYMKHHFAFLGIPAPLRERLTRDALKPLGRPSPDDALAAAYACWAQSEREWQYIGCELLRKVERQLAPEALGPLEQLITTKSWWDTVDDLAGHPVCSIVRQQPAARAVMDRWLASENMWLTRTAILHQLHAGADTDAEWLFAACTARATETEFFIRKAIGWALRSYAHQGPTQADAVRALLAEQGPRLSGLSQREALKRVRH